MKTIKELKAVCQDPVKGKDGEFDDVWYRPISIHITRLLLFTPITADQVTALSIFFGILGGLFMSMGGNIPDMIAVIFLQFYCLLDFSDGEIARYKKTESLTGHYFDFLAHYIVFPVFLIGMTFGAYKDAGGIWIFVFGFSAIICVSLHKDIVTTIYWIVCNKRKSVANQIGIEEKQLKEEMSEKSTVSPLNLKSKIKTYYEKMLRKSPRLKITIRAFVSVFGREVGSEMFIMLTIFFPTIADIVFGGVSLWGKSYRFMTIYLILLGGLSPVFLIVKIVRNIKTRMPEKEYQKLFG